MFKLYDNRTELYQWDLNRKVIVSDDTVTEVHFCNKTDDCSLVVPTYRLADANILVADIPNILLQDNWNIRCYAYCTDYTKTEALFKVKPRTQPSDYIYEETETLKYSTLSQRMDEGATVFYINLLDIPMAGADAPQIVIDAIDHYEKYKNAIIYLSTLSHRNDYIPASITGDLNGYTISAASSHIDDIEAGRYALEYSVIVRTNTTPWTASRQSSSVQIATKKYVDEAIAGVETGGVDLSDYYTKTEVDDIVANAQGSDDYYTKEEVDTAITDAINSVDTTIPEEYTTETEVKALINEALGVIENGTY